jgi:hypothetical protein
MQNGTNPTTAKYTFTDILASSVPLRKFFKTVVDTAQFLRLMKRLKLLRKRARFTFQAPSNSSWMIQDDKKLEASIPSPTMNGPQWHMWGTLQDFAKPLSMVTLSMSRIGAPKRGWMSIDETILAELLSILRSWHPRLKLFSV